MFPLGTVLFPSVYLPLHVFEDRYRTLVRDCLASDREFGVVLIERGSEVGGGDTRTGVGTVAQIVEAVEMDDGRWALGTVGVRRVRIRRWRHDDPYPRAEVEDWPDQPGRLPIDQGPAAAQLRRVLALAAEMGDHVVDSTVDLADDPELASYQMAAVAPFGPADQQRLLALASTGERLEALTGLLGDVETDLAARLRMHPGSG